jgi:hypothetical protein
MKTIIKKYFTTLVLLTGVFSLSQAQKDTISPELTKTIKVQSEYTPQISDVVRLSVNPVAYDTLDLHVDLKYSIQSTPIETAYTIKPLKPVSVKGDKLPELFRGYAALGLGNYNSTYFNVRYMTERSRNKQYGFELYHLGSAGKVRFSNDEKYPAGYSHTYLNAYGKKFFTNCIGTAAVKPSFNNVLKYGHQPYDATMLGIIPDTSFRKKDIRRNFIVMNTKIGLQSNTSDNAKLRYTSELEHNLTIVNPKSTENNLNLNISANQQFDQIKTGAELQVFWSGINFTPIDTNLTKNATLVRLLPHVGTTVDDWTLRVGINVMQSFGISKFKAYPDVQFDYNLFNYSLIPFVRYSGKLQEYSLCNILTENPYTSDYTMLEPTNYKMLLDLGAKGRVQRSFPFLVSCNISQFENLYFWVNDTLATNDAQNSFTAVYDNGTEVTIHAETGVKHKLLDINVEANYNMYSLDSLDKAWHRPGFESKFTCKYNIINPLTNKNKLIVSSQIMYEDLLYAQDINGNAKKMNPIFDVNLGLEYYYNSVFVIFANVNNITATKYSNYYLYPNQRTNFLIGLTYSFAGLKL